MDSKVLVYAQELLMGLNGFSQNMLTTNKLFTLFLFIICVSFISLYLVSTIIENQRKLHKDKAENLAEGVGSNSKFVNNDRVQAHVTIRQHKIQHFAPCTQYLIFLQYPPEKGNFVLLSFKFVTCSNRFSSQLRFNKDSFSSWNPFIVIDVFTFNCELDLRD